MPFLLVAGWTRENEVLPDVQPASAERSGVIDVIASGNIAAAVCATSSLSREHMPDIVSGDSLRHSVLPSSGVRRVCTIPVCVSRPSTPLCRNSEGLRRISCISFARLTVLFLAIGGIPRAALSTLDFELRGAIRAVVELLALPTNSLDSVDSALLRREELRRRWLDLAALVAALGSRRGDTIGAHRTSIVRCHAPGCLLHRRGTFVPPFYSPLEAS